jgi:hypothetical protein
MRAAVPGLSVAEIDDMEYVDWVVYRDIAAAWRARHGFGGE